MIDADNNIWESICETIRLDAASKSISLAVVEDDSADYFLLSLLLKQMDETIADVSKYDSLSALMNAADSESYNVIILDRYLENEAPSEGRIRELRAAFPDSSVIMYTHQISTSLRSHAAHEGAFAVVEKNSLDKKEFCSLIEAAAIVGNRVTNDVGNYPASNGAEGLKHMIPKVI